jgi:hypothetical protein
MKHIQNDYMKAQLQNALLAQEISEAAKIRQAERARAKAADAVEKLHPENNGQTVKKTQKKSEDGKGGQKKSPPKSGKWRYRPDGALEEEGGPGPSPTTRIDLKA